MKYRFLIFIAFIGLNGCGHVTQLQREDDNRRNTLDINDLLKQVRSLEERMADLEKRCVK